jgi:hypothetical protein
MTDYDCPLCSNGYEDRTDLRIHLEVNHRKSMVVSKLVEATTDSAGSEDRVPEGDRPAPTL